MINKDTLIKVFNKYNGTVGYTVPDLGVHRNFYPGESKSVTFDQLEKLSFTPGGNVILKDFLEITDKDAIAELFDKQFQPEYYYTKDDIKELMINGSLDQFLDCLDFSPEVVKEMIKDMAVELPLNDIEKRQAIQEKLNFDVTKAIEIRNTKYDGSTTNQEEKTNTVSGRRVAAPVKPETIVSTGRRYKPVTKTE